MQVLQKHNLIVPFKDIEVGQPFRFEDSIYICITEIEDRYEDIAYNAVDLKTGTLYEFSNDEVVEPVHAVVEEID